MTIMYWTKEIKEKPNFVLLVIQKKLHCPETRPRLTVNIDRKICVSNNKIVFQATHK